tara:strand:+ start:15427 stop:18006 length:2580 start_codon:yes stop_codon:yes gene_type:complete
MFNSLLRKIFGSRNSRLLGEYKSFITEINSLEREYQALSQDGLKSRTTQLKTEYDKSGNLDYLLAEAFALVREASVRTLGMRHYDEQLLGGIVLHFGKIAEMKTGEGKTLVSTLPAYLNSLSGESVFIITVNDYLARRDSEWMGKIYTYLGLSVGVITSDMDLSEKKEQYTKDIIYGTNNEFGFDYLRDNMVYDISDKVQGKLSYAIVDEVDSVLIDEARTPLIISGSANESTNLYQKINKLAQLLIKNNLNDDFYIIDEKQKNVSLTENGHAEIESLLLKQKYINNNDNLYNPKNIQLLQIFNSCLRANLIYQIDIDYVVENDAVVIIDEFSGRKMPGRRWAEGLHQSIEAKENVSIQNENQTYASITFQNYFRLFNKLSGMTGTADTEALEFQQIYNLEVVVIPTHMKMIRNDHVDLIYLTSEEKYHAILENITDIHKQKQPVLVGTTSIEASEYLSKLLKKQGVRHSVLNAKHHQKEAEIIAQAGKLGSVTIATNMAGRGTDIVLGGKMQSPKISDENINEKDKVRNLGGLYIIGTERHESRRVDNQLRGRAGRQGDPGETKFFLSLEDNLMRIFASERVSEIMKKLGMQKGEAIEHKWVSKSIENAQKRVEAHNFDIRKTLLEYDDISNEQRKIIYNQRNQILNLNSFDKIIESMIDDISLNIVKSYMSTDEVSNSSDFSQIIDFLNAEFILDVNETSFSTSNGVSEDMIKDISKYIHSKINSNIASINSSDKTELIRNIFLTVIDEDWRNHLNAMDYLRQSIGLRGYAQKNPKNEYKRESFEMFEEMLYTNSYEIIKILARIKVKDNTSIDKSIQKNDLPQNTKSVNNDKDIPRNAPCPCGSGKKYKRCCGKLS